MNVSRPLVCSPHLPQNSMWVDGSMTPLPAGPITVVILVVDYISELTIHSVYACPLFWCKGNVQHFISSELDAADCAQLV